MSIEIEEVVRLCEQLPASQRSEVAEFARSLLSRAETVTPVDKVAQWLGDASAVVRPGVRTDDIMTMTRGES